MWATFRLPGDVLPPPLEIFAREPFVDTPLRLLKSHIQGRIMDDNNRQVSCEMDDFKVPLYTKLTLLACSCNREIFSTVMKYEKKNIFWNPYQEKNFMVILFQKNCLIRTREIRTDGRVPPRQVSIQAITTIATR